jgi:hypothetical protein
LCDGHVALAATITSQASPRSGERSQGIREGRHDCLERPIQHSAVRTPLADPVRVEGHHSDE